MRVEQGLWWLGETGGQLFTTRDNLPLLPSLPRHAIVSNKDDVFDLFDVFGVFDVFNVFALFLIFFDNLFAFYFLFHM